MTETTVWDATFGAFEVTDAMRNRYTHRVIEHLAGTVDLWESNGEDIKSPEASQAIRLMHHELMLIDHPEWTHPARAAGIIGSQVGVPSGQTRVEVLSAMRTAWSMTHRDWRQAVADCLGVSPSQIRYAYGVHSHVARERRRELRDCPTALYRHYDARGELLYIGISNSPENRAKLHSFESPWWKHVADSRIEWFTNRPTALLAEADAIAAESPIFNVQHTLRSVWDDSRAAYLLKAKSEAAVNA